MKDEPDEAREEFLYLQGRYNEFDKPKGDWLDTISN